MNCSEICVFFRWIATWLVYYLCRSVCYTSIANVHVLTAVYNKEMCSLYSKIWMLQEPCLLITKPVFCLYSGKNFYNVDCNNVFVLIMTFELLNMICLDHFFHLYILVTCFTSRMNKIVENVWISSLHCVHCAIW